jgi:hypothetical protein
VPLDQFAKGPLAKVNELPMKFKDKSPSSKVAQLQARWHGRSLKNSEKRALCIGIGCILGTTGLTLAYTLGAWHALTALMAGPLAEEVPSYTSANVTMSASALTITTDSASTQDFQDGTQADLAAGTALDVDYSSSRRALRLRAGEATFEVARDPDRPFVVWADGLTATALGTKFKVALAPIVCVQVYEGVVAVSEGSGKASQQLRRILKAGEVYTRRNSGKACGGGKTVDRE